MTKKRIVIVCAVVLVVLLLLWLNAVVLHVQPADIQEIVEAAGWFAPFLFIMLYAVRPLILFPASIMSLAGGLLFGAWGGLVANVVGAVAGASLSFMAARRLGTNIAGKEWKGKASGLQRQLETNGFLYTILLRLIPVLNFDLVSYVCGISKVSFRAYFFATLFGIIPGAIGYSLLGAGLVGGDFTQLVTAAAVLLAVSLLAFLLRRVRAGRKLIAHTKKEDE